MNSSAINNTTSKEASLFLEEAKQFQLGILPTEQSNTKTELLSQLAQLDLEKAIYLFCEIEQDALQGLLKKIPELEALKNQIKTQLLKQKKIFICGCGATGRLALSLESLWRSTIEKNLSTSKPTHLDLHPPKSDHTTREQPELKAIENNIIGFIAGGDYAMVKSIENFEDHPEYGERQLLELGYTNEDMLICCTEGGETPFVIGACLKAAQMSNQKTHFLFCNHFESLSKIERSTEVFKHPNVQSLSLYTGPQAIRGSTRLQASSVLLFAVGTCLFQALQEIYIPDQNTSISKHIESYLSFLKSVKLDSLKDLVLRETHIYKTSGLSIFSTEHQALSVLTDLTERSPTFNLKSIENYKTQSNFLHTHDFATASLRIKLSPNEVHAWKQIFKRDLRCLNWTELNDQFNEDIVLGFNFSNPGTLKRIELAKKMNPNINLQIFDISESLHELQIHCELNEQTQSSLKFQYPQELLHRNLFLKFILNASSSLSMCLLNRVHGNMMLYVKPSNKKLIDRAARYTQELFKQKTNKAVSYEDCIKVIFSMMPNLKSNESIVLLALEKLIQTS